MTQAMNTESEMDQLQQRLEIACSTLNASHDAETRAAAIDEVGRLADAGLAKAIFIQGVWAQAGEFAEADPGLAAALYEKAGELGCMPAWRNLGILRQTGLGIDADMALAAAHYARAMDGGDAQAAINLGILHEAGQLDAASLDTAAECYRQAIYLGHPEGEARLRGVLTASGVPAFKQVIPKPPSQSLIGRILRRLKLKPSGS